jgi:predicted enzyme related to lactoylglutathione lyase
LDKGRYISRNPIDMNPVVHFEMPAEDRQRVSKFYSDVFGWQMTQLGPEMGDYLIAYTSEVDENRMHKHKGAINGGFFPKEPDNAHPSLTIAVDDVKAHIEKVKQGGGTVLGEPKEIPGIGLYVSILDTEGNRVSLLQAYQR